MTKSTGFVFVNITNPEEAKSVKNRRKVRQHVRYKKTSTDSKAAKAKQACETSSKQKRNAILEAGNSSQIILSLPEQGTRSDLMTFVRKQAQRRSRKGEKNIVQEKLKNCWCDLLQICRNHICDSLDYEPYGSSCKPWELRK